MRRLAIFFVTGKAPLLFYRKLAEIPLGPRDKGSGELDPRPVGAPDPFWRWSVRSAKKVYEHATKAKLLPHQFAIGVPNGAERMGKSTAFDAAHLHFWPGSAPTFSTPSWNLSANERLKISAEFIP